jgi:hypothetical protein
MVLEKSRLMGGFMKNRTYILLALCVFVLSFLPAIGAPVTAQDGGTTERVSVASDGTQGNGNPGSFTISADGRYVAFDSWASNLVSGDTNGRTDVFVHDRQTGQTTCVSVAYDGTLGNGDSISPSISADGRYVAFDSGANNLVSGDTNGTSDIFVHDRLTGLTSLVSVASDGTQGNSSTMSLSISADGRYVAFESWASNLVSGDTNSTVTSSSATGKRARPAWYRWPRMAPRETAAHTTPPSPPTGVMWHLNRGLATWSAAIQRGRTTFSSTTGRRA